MTPCNAKPGERELWKKINAAKKLIAVGDWEPCNPGHLDDNLRELEDKFGTEWATDEDKLDLFKEALSEIKAKHYCETRKQPEVSVELATAGLKMWKFKWQSDKDCFGKCLMYIKFSIVGTGDVGPLWIHSLHPDDPPPQE
jgi:hypothetical protein